MPLCRSRRLSGGAGGGCAICYRLISLLLPLPRQLDPICHRFLFSSSLSRKEEDKPARRYRVVAWHFSDSAVPSDSQRFISLDRIFQFKTNCRSRTRNSWTVLSEMSQYGSAANLSSFRERTGSPSYASLGKHRVRRYLKFQYWFSFLVEYCACFSLFRRNSCFCCFLLRPECQPFSDFIFYFIVIGTHFNRHSNLICEKTNQSWKTNHKSKILSRA